MSAPVVELPERMNAIVDASDGSSYTYAEVLEQVNRTGNALKELGVRREERVTLLLFDSPEFVFNFFGAIKIGAVPIPTNTLLRSSDYEYMLNDSRAEVLIVSKPLLAQIEPIRERLR